MQFICAYLAWIYTDIEQWKIWCCCLHALFVQLGISERSIQVGSLIWSSFCFGRAWNKLCHSRVDVRWCESYPLSQGLEPNSVCVRINCFHFSHIKRDSSSSNLHTPGLPNPGFTLDCPNMSHGQNTEWLGRIPKRRINQSAMHGSPISTLAYTNFYWKQNLVNITIQYIFMTSLPLEGFHCINICLCHNLRITKVYKSHANVQGAVALWWLQVLTRWKAISQHDPLVRCHPRPLNIAGRLDWAVSRHPGATCRDRWNMKKTYWSTKKFKPKLISQRAENYS